MKCRCRLNLRKCQQKPMSNSIIRSPFSITRRLITKYHPLQYQERDLEGYRLMIRSGFWDWCLNTLRIH